MIFEVYIMTSPSRGPQCVGRDGGSLLRARTLIPGASAAQSTCYCNMLLASLASVHPLKHEEATANLNPVKDLSIKNVELHDLRNYVPTHIVSFWGKYAFTMHRSDLSLWSSRFVNGPHTRRSQSASVQSYSKRRTVASCGTSMWWWRPA